MEEYHIESFLEQYPDLIEEGLKVLERQRRTEFGIMDLLCQDLNGKHVIVEIKIETDHASVAQVAKYVLSLEKEGIPRKQIRGMLVTRFIGKETQELCDYFNIETRSLVLAPCKTRRNPTEEFTISTYKKESSEPLSLSPRELSVLRTILDLNQKGKIADYPTIAKELSISESTVRGFVNSLAKKEIPIIKQKMLPSGLKFKLTPELIEKLNNIKDNF